MHSQEPAAEAVYARLDAGETVPGDELRRAVPIDDAFGVGLLGIAWESFSAAAVTAHLDVDERLHQPYGIVHGGVWCSVVETLASVGAWLRVASQGLVVVGVNNTTDFLRPVATGRVSALGEPVHVGRTQQLWVVNLRRDDGKPVARGQVRLQNLDPTSLPR